MRHVFSKHYFDYSELEVWGTRRRPVFGDVVRALKSRGVQTIFDVGAAFGHFVQFADSRGFTASGSDLSDNAVKVARERLGVTLHAGSLSDLDLSSQFDAVVSLDTFYYVADPRAELEAIRRILKPNGVLLLRLRNCHRSEPAAEHLWGFTPESITRVLEVAGWKVEQIEPASYSATSLRYAQAFVVGLNRLLRPIGVPVLTHNFSIIARVP
ncbi:MAG: class I SAM-dependent methyltransferase [Gemmatimonadota bacterium]|nr:class I SAM-dependent methyltransferase [Gemmatimonadota bacterium]